MTAFYLNIIDSIVDLKTTVIILTFFANYNITIVKSSQILFHFPLNLNEIFSFKSSKFIA